ncbi:sugar transferase [Pararhizobium sp. PWRC1-1]|uniref:sugar transferase n=1 Tax=Pararhizobium sp. PWRC1-1 TaxID=2804566 RepID=UPI003CF22C48
MSSAFPSTGIYKRALDVVASCATIVLLSPVLASVAIMVKICDGGPVLFRHRRIGFGGQTFECLKFRTMKIDAELRLQEWLLKNPVAAEEWNATQKLKYDPRLTPIGKSLRRSSLDELPQLFNVFRGEMSLVGPRPVVAEEVPRYGRDIAHYYSVRPGLTGAWQVSGRNDVSYTERVRLDTEYCTTWSFTKDLTIMLKTLPVLLSRRGSY